MKSSVWSKIHLFIRQCFWIGKLAVRLTLMNVMILIPSLHRKMVENVNQMLSIPGEDVIKSSLGWNTWTMFISIARNSKIVLQQKAKQGCDAPNARLLLLDDESECRLLDFMKPGRALVVNFGSAS